MNSISSKTRILKEYLSWIFDNSTEVKIHYKSKEIPRIFSCISYYKKKFEPLLLEEIREKIKHTLSTKNDLRVIKNCIIKEYYFKKGELFIMANFQNDEMVQIDKISFIILSFFYIGKYNENEKKCLISGTIIKINYKTKIIIIKIDIKNRHLLNAYKNQMSIITFNQNLTIYPYLKEYIYLYSLEKIPNSIKNTILNCTTNNITWFDKLNCNKYKLHLKKHFNESQTNAILAILKSEISLIQGPPGTGKTRTIVGIISILLRNFKINIQAIDYKRNEIYLNQKYGIFSKRLIICATANAAVDENAIRSSIGFVFQRKKKNIQPYNIIRMGPNYHFSLDHISLDNLSFTWASENDEKIKFWNDVRIIQKSRNYLLKKVTIIYTTLACAGYSIFDKLNIPEYIIIDEAAQAIEIDTLIPLRNTCKKLIMVGDVQQLPATIFSKYSILYEYDRSLFKRLQLQKYPVFFLETQYRMHPQISSFPSRKFYNNGLKDSEHVAIAKKVHILRCFGPLVFFDIRESNENNHMLGNFSWCNLDETRVINLLVKSLLCVNSYINIKSIGVISGYNGQIKEIEKYFDKKRMDLRQQVNTVDGFQGKEKEIIFFSCVRSKFERGIGFLSDCRRMNVAFTRAKIAFWITGNFSTLIKDSNWKEVILDAQKRLRFFLIKKPLERSSRRLVYWSIIDEENYYLDGESNFPIFYKLLFYLKKKNVKKQTTIQKEAV